MNPDYKGYVVTLGEVLVQLAKEAKAEKESTVGTDSESFATGYLAAFHRIITLMQQHAETYDLPPQEISINELDESDLV